MAKIIFPLIMKHKGEHKDERRYHIRYHQGSVIGAIDVTVVRDFREETEYDIHIRVISDLPSLHSKEWRSSARTVKKAQAQRAKLFRLARQTVKDFLD